MSRQGTDACERLSGLLAAYADGELNKRQAGAVARHVATCAACARALEEQRALVALLTEQAQSLMPPPSLHASVMQTVKGMAQQRVGGTRAALVRRAAGVTAAFVVLVGVTVALATGGLFDGVGKESVMDFEAHTSMEPSDGMLQDAADGANKAEHYGGAELPSPEPGAAADDMAEVPMETPSEEAAWEYVLYSAAPVTADRADGLDGVWQGDGMMLSLVSSTGEVELALHGEAARSGRFEAMDGILTLQWEDGECLTFDYELRGDTLWLRCR